MSVIRKELETRLLAFANSLSPKIPIAWEGSSFSRPSPPVPFLESVLVPESTKDVSVDGLRQRRRGCLQVNIWYPVDGRGSAGADAIAEALTAAFPLVPKTGTVSIESTPHVGRPLGDIAGWRITPVTISYRYES